MTLTYSGHTPFSLHLHYHAPHGIDPPGLPVVMVTRVAGHGVCYWRGVAVDPMLVHYIMTVCTWRGRGAGLAC